MVVVRSSLYAQIRDHGYWSATGCGISPLNSAILSVSHRYVLVVTYASVLCRAAALGQPVMLFEGYLGITFSVKYPSRRLGESAQLT